MDRAEKQTRIDISGTEYPRFKDEKGNSLERFWFIKDEFLQHSEKLLNTGRRFSSFGGKLENDRWVCDGRPITKDEMASLLMGMRLFHMKSECMSIHAFCSYMENTIDNDQVRRFYVHMRESWEKYLEREPLLMGEFTGSIKANKNLIDAVLYSGNMHIQEKPKKRYRELLEHMDESSILMCVYHAMHNGYQMNQISRSIKELREDNPIILLPDHLRHEWDKNCPYQIS